MDKVSTASIDVGYVAQLARLQLTEEEQATFQQQLADVLGYVNQLAEVDFSPLDGQDRAEIVNHLRKDIPRESLPREIVLQNAPAHSPELFLMPKVVE
jgi:aspartyl-tRNA(Asn)/glutamyl-tRNA(Gln) amidotransferase subunit C